MKLLAFVLLGFLAHSCIGTYQTSQKVFQDHVCSVFDKNFENYDDCKLLPFNILNIGEVIASATGLVSLKAALTYQGNNIYKLVIGGAVNLNSLNIKGLGLSVHVTGKLGVAVNEGCLEANLIEGSLEINLQVANQAVFLGIGGVLGSLTGSITKTIINSFTSNCQQLFQGKILEIIQSSLASFNTKNKGITTPVYSYGSWINLEISEIECTADSIVQYVDLGWKKTGDTETKKTSIGNGDITDLPNGVASSLSLNEDFFGTIFGAACDDVIPSYKKTLTNAEWQEYGVYPGIQGDPTVSVKKPSAPSYNIKSSGGSVSQPLQLQVSDSTDHAIVDIDVNVDLDLDLSRKNNKFECTLGKPSISNRRVSYRDEGCDCGDGDDDDDVFLAFIEALIETIIEEVIDAITCILSQGFPCIDALTEDWPSESECSPVEEDKSYKCVCNEY